MGRACLHYLQFQKCRVQRLKTWGQLSSETAKSGLEPSLPTPGLVRLFSLSCISQKSCSYNCIITTKKPSKLWTLETSFELIITCTVKRSTEVTSSETTAQQSLSAPSLPAPSSAKSGISPVHIAGAGGVARAGAGQPADTSSPAAGTEAQRGLSPKRPPAAQALRVKGKLRDHKSHRTSRC